MQSVSEIKIKIKILLTINLSMISMIKKIGVLDAGNIKEKSKWRKNDIILISIDNIDKYRERKKCPTLRHSARLGSVVTIDKMSCQ